MLFRSYKDIKTMINQKKMRKNIKRKTSKKQKFFIALWADDNGNGTFGVLASLCKTKEAAIVEVLKDIEINNYIDPIKLNQCRLTLTSHNELNIPGVISYKIESVYKNY